MGCGFLLSILLSLPVIKFRPAGATLAARTDRSAAGPPRAGDRAQDRAHGARGGGLHGAGRGAGLRHRRGLGPRDGRGHHGAAQGAPRSHRDRTLPLVRIRCHILFELSKRTLAELFNEFFLFSLLIFARTSCNLINLSFKIW